MNSNLLVQYRRPIYVSISHIYVPYINICTLRETYICRYSYRYIRQYTK